MNFVVWFEVLILSCVDVVIVGGGIIGISIVFYFVEVGVGNIVFIEWNMFGFGFFVKLIGGICVMFFDLGNIMFG